MIIIDIGACVGGYIDSCLLTYAVEKIYAFEPLRCNYDFLVEKYKGDARIAVINAAVSGFDGKAKFYKKFLEGRHSEHVGCEGSSLYSNKQGISKRAFDEVSVIRLSSFVKQNDIRKIDILKIDAEGSEYEIFQDIFDKGIYNCVGKFCYEDHCRKIKGLDKERDRFIKKVNLLNIGDKIYTEGITNQYDTRFNNI